jgi:hypothetical protein
MMSLRLRFVSLLGAVLGFGAAFAAGMGVLRTADSAREVLLPAAAAAPGVSPYPSRFLLNALLLPALDPDAMPFRWVDPRPVLGCGPDSEVRVNGAPLVAGALVPETPFELAWQSDGCRPFGRGGPRFDGRVQLTVVRESWGFSAEVEPSDLRVAWGKGGAAWVEPGSTSMPLCIDRNEPDQPIVGPDVVVQCR